MATNDTFDQPREHHHINWGGVLKGVAIVAGIAVAAVVGAWVVGGIASYLTGAVTANAGASALAAGAHTLAVDASTGFGWMAGKAALILSGIPSGLASILGLTGQHFAQSAAVNSTLGLVGGAAAGVAATHAALPYLQHGHYVDVDTSAAHGGEAGMIASTVPMHDLTHITHHAAEHADEHMGLAWSQKFAPRATTYGSFAENVRAQKEERKAIAPSENFAEQVNASRADLDAALAK